MALSTLGALIQLLDDWSEVQVAFPSFYRSGNSALFWRRSLPTGAIIRALKGPSSDAGTARPHRPGSRYAGLRL